MNAIKSCRYLWPHFNRNANQIFQKNARLFCSANKLIDIDVNSKTGISTVTFKRPPVNSLSLELVTEFVNAIIRLEKEKVKGMIVTSMIPGVFSAGLDFTEIYQPNQDRLKAYWTAVQDMWLNLYSSGYTTVAAVAGHCPGAGCVIAITCDYRVMVQGEFGIGLNETQLGLAVPSWVVDTYLNVVPRRIAELALISGKMFTAEEARKISLVDEVAQDVPDAISKAEAHILKLSKLSQFAMTQTKLKVRYSAIKRLQDAREDDLRVFLNFVNSHETQKGLEMYMQKLKGK